MNSFCCELSTSKTWYQDLVAELAIDPNVSDTALRLFLYIQNQTDPSSAEEFGIQTSLGTWLFCALLLCHKYLQENEHDQFHNLIHIKANFFHPVHAAWPYLEMHYLRKLDFQLEKFLHRVHLLNVDSV